jgi:DNA-binding beta-propeller fold protein YncE
VVDPERHCAIAIALEDAPLDVVTRPESVFIYTTNLHSLTVIDTWTAAAKSILIGELPRRLNVSMDGRRLYGRDTVGPLQVDIASCTRLILLMGPYGFSTPPTTQLWALSRSVRIQEQYH